MKKASNYLIQTDRLSLRPFDSGDADIIFSLYSDEEVMRYMPWDLMTQEQVKAHLEAIAADWQATPPISMEMAVILLRLQEFNHLAPKSARTICCLTPPISYAHIAQLDRALASQAKGRAFESR